MNFIRTETVYYRQWHTKRKERWKRSVQRAVDSFRHKLNETYFFGLIQSNVLSSFHVSNRSLQIKRIHWFVDARTFITLIEVAVGPSATFNLNWHGERERRTVVIVFQQMVFPVQCTQTHTHFSDSLARCALNHIHIHCACIVYVWRFCVIVRDFWNIDVSVR